MGILSWVGNRLASELHRSELEKLQERIAQVEKTPGTLLYRLEENERRLQTLEERLRAFEIGVAKVEGALETIPKLLVALRVVSAHPLWIAFVQSLLGVTTWVLLWRLLVRLAGRRARGRSCSASHSRPRRSSTRRW